MVKFCDKCGNLYNHVIDNTGQFIYSCAICGNINTNVEQCIVINELNRNAHDYQLNPNIIYDVTLPRTKQIPCQNSTCPSKKGKTSKNPEIVIYQYNHDMLNIGYMCTICRNYWKN